MNRQTLFSAVITIVAHCARAEFIISPNQPTLAADRGPFLVTQSQASSVRFQEVHGASDFRSLTTAVWITEFSLWRVPDTLPIDLMLPNVAIHFSTTTRTPHQLSATFAENIGLDETSVFSGPLHLVDTGGEFGISIPFQTPFLYDPERGNLLMDIWNYSTVPTPTGGGYLIHWQGTFVDSISGLSSLDAGATVGFTYNGGMITRFTVTPVPEASTWLLLILGTAVLTLYGTTRKILHR